MTNVKLYNKYGEFSTSPRDGFKEIPVKDLIDDVWYIVDTKNCGYYECLDEDAQKIVESILEGREAFLIEMHLLIPEIQNAFVPKMHDEKD